jgi:PleD family two-component response regulator
MTDGRPANDDLALTTSDAAVLMEEIGRLRFQLAKYEERLVELDRLANCDPLVNLSNRRSCFVSLASSGTMPGTRP